MMAFFLRALIRHLGFNFLAVHWVFVFGTLLVGNEIFNDLYILLFCSIVYRSRKDTYFELKSYNVAFRCTYGVYFRYSG